MGYPSVPSLCRFCGKRFLASRTGAELCSYRCRNDDYLRRRKERRAERRNLTYEHCGKPFVGSRCDAKFCSSACRQANHRNG